MATPYPFPGGFQRRPRTSERMIRTTFNVVALGAFASAPVAAVALWLLLTNPVLANEVAESNSLMPLMRTLVVSVGKAIAAALAWL
jgi:hypothetical protein